MATEIISTFNQQNQSGQLTDWLSWKTWKETINEHSAVIGMQFLNEFCKVYQAELTKVKEKYEGDEKKLYDQYLFNRTSISSREDIAINELEETHELELISVATRERESYIAYDADLSEYLNETETGGFIRKIVEKLIAGQIATMESDIDSAFQQTAIAREQLKDALDIYREQLKLLFEKKKEQLHASAEIERERESIKYAEEMKRLQTDFKRATSNMERRFRNILCEVMSDNDIKSYIEMVLPSGAAYEEYSCSTTIPEYVCFGNVTMEVAQKIDIHQEIIQLIISSAIRALDASTPGLITAKLPYFQRLDDGISMFLSYSPNERIKYQDYLKMMLLKLFMVFPAGKLEAVMIDPLELGETFAMFTKLGEEQSRIIDTKIWSQEKDISEAISILRQKLETMTQSYGNDKATRLKKEPVRVLAITDFPIGFTQNALDDLQAIVRKSASYGVCVFIWANNQEIVKLQDSQQSVFNEIKQMLHVASVTEYGTLELETAKYKNVLLQLDPLSMVQDNIENIINTLTKGIHNSQKIPEKFEDMYDNIEDPDNWFTENTVDEFSIPIGIKGANSIVKMIIGKTDGSTAHHALIAGQTGAGKSTLLHTIIMSTLLNYLPEEAQLYLLDFKEGVEFKTYSKLNLPSIRVVAIDCEREFGLNVLKELQKEMKRRYDLFQREADSEEISEYRKLTGKNIPKLLVVFDEVQELFRGASYDSISKECENILGMLLTLGRAAGIHIILASQNFNLISSIKPTLFAHAAIRIAIKGSEDSASSVLGENNLGAKQLQDGAAGAAVYNDASGKESDNVIFRVGYLKKDNRAKYLDKLNKLQNSGEFAGKYTTKTRILLNSAEDDIFNVFNQLIINKQAFPWDNDETRCCLIIGDGFEMNRKFSINIAPFARQNLLIIGKDEMRAASIFYFSILSLLYGELVNTKVRKDSRIIYLIDLSAEDEYIEPSDTHFKHIKALFPEQIERVGMRDIDKLICNTYNTLVRRMDGEGSSEDRLFLMFFGINRAYKLTSDNMYEDEYIGEMSTLTKLTEIIKQGGKYGINCIVWGENLPATNKVIGANFERNFAQRIVFASDSNAMEQLVMEQNTTSLRSTTAIYMNVEDEVKNTHFRIYEIPTKDWVEEIAKAYYEIS